MKINIDFLSDDFSYFVWEGLTDIQRLELIKKLVYTSPNCQKFCDKTTKKLNKLKNKLD